MADIVERRPDDNDPFNAGWNACHEAMSAETERLRAALTAALPAIDSCMADDNPIWLDVMAALSTNKEGEM